MDVAYLNHIEEVLEEMTSTGFVAGANCLVLKKGQPVYYCEKGYADIANQIPVRKDSIFRLYSMTKPITAAAVMLLVQDGKLDLNSPVCKYLPTYEHQTYLSGDEKKPVKRPMKVKDLLNMTAGLSYGGLGNENESLTTALTTEGIRRLNTDNEMTTREFALKMGEIPLLFSPGESFRYSFCADILGAIVEIVSGMRFGEFLKKRLFEPLSMEDTGFYVPKEKRERLVKVYAGKKDGLKEYDFNHLIINLSMDHEPAFESGGAGLCTTIEDYAKFASMLMNGGVYEGKRIFEPGVLKFMTEGVMDAGPRLAFKDWDGLEGFDYANLLRVMRDPGQAVTLGSKGEYGWDGWLGPYFANDPAHEITILHMIQRTDCGTTEYMRRIRNIVYATVED